MNITGTSSLAADRATVWRALNDPAVLVATIPGCKRLEALGADEYAMTVAAGVGSIKGVYDGRVALSDQQEPGSFTMTAQGAGAAGTIGASVLVTLADSATGGTELTYSADAVVGGMIGGVGQRMLTGVSKRMASEFFSNVDAMLAGTAAGRPPGSRRRRRRPTTPRSQARSGGQSHPRSAAPPTSARLLLRPGPSSPRPRLAQRLGRRDQGSWSGSRWEPRLRSRARWWVAGSRAVAADMTDIDVYSTAREMAAAVAAKEISARELLELHLARIAATNGVVNAVVSLDEERARAAADEADARTAAGEPLGPLHGLPHAFKDTHEVAGWRTTYGSPLRADHVPKRDDLVVERVRQAGVVTIGKTNVPEWAAGSHTFNPVFGLTRNPYDPSRSAGGSSGGAAAALATGMVPLADGSDMGGSLRNPASFNNVVGLRPTVGRVPTWPTTNAWELTSVSGPMARNVEDLALLLSVMSGPSRRAPLSLETPGRRFAPPLTGDLAGLRVALSVDLGGSFAVDHAVADVVRRQAEVFDVRRRPRRGGAPGAAQRGVGLPDAAGVAVPAPVPRHDRQASRRVQAVAGRQHPARRGPDRRRRGPGLPAADLDPGPRPRVLRAARRARAAGQPGAAVRRRPGVPARHQRRRAGDLPRLDAIGLPASP